MASEPEQALVNVAAAKATAWFLHNSLDAFVGLRNGQLEWVGGAWTTLTGWADTSTVGRPYSDFLFREDVAAAMTDIDGLPRNGRGVFTYRIAAKSRGWLWMRHHAVRGDDGWVLMILRDITAERQRELDNEQARRVAAMVRGDAGVIPWRYEADEDIFEIDPDFTAHHDKSAAEYVTGDAYRAAIHSDDLAKVQAAFDRTIATGASGEVEYRHQVAKGGGWRRTHGVWQGVRRRASGKWDLVGVNADITEIAEARDAAVRGEQAARAAAEAKQRFLANISHEIRTPMNGVLGVLHLIKAEPPRAERQKLVDQALAAGVGLSDLLNDIIDFSHVESGQLVLAAEPVDPAEQLESVVAMFRPQALAKTVALEVKASADLGWVAADPARLRKLFFHLVGNAVKFTHHGGVEARLSATGAGEARRLRLEVEDTGVGIPTEAQGAIFHHFTQADSSVTRRYGGPGLGLAVTKGLAELMGGLVGFVSEPGRGSTFWVEVAAPEAAAPSESADDDGGAWLAGVRVLLVEDNPTNRLVATRMLSQLGAEVVTANDGAEGVAAVEVADFDLVFMDIQMPVMDGVEATRRIRAMAGPKHRVPIVATTANVMPEQLATYRESGINGVVAKPISPAALLTEVARIAGEAEAA
jgi:signal transduction histidine kinase/BarA-like signal transduction histidine kinase